MLEIQNNLLNNSHKKKIKNIKSTKGNKNFSAAKYLSNKFIIHYNLQDPNSKTSNHLIKIFSYFLKYDVQNIDLIKSYTEDKGECLEFKVNLFSNSEKQLMETNQENYEIISLRYFFNENFKLILI